ncbi:DUF6206 family protein [Streptomyces sp. MAR4 CNX-425]|uniref:DUF6206 family protein n=1 Tax=Streptomyces sp. MAR4 CNX-425 TaxID=3406343 RepID=UPI003B51220F
MTFAIPGRELQALEEQVQTALRTGDDGGLTVLGYGEVTLVLGLETARGTYACKRLPLLPGERDLARYADRLDDYIGRLTRAGVRVAETRVWHHTLASGEVVAYCVQEALPAKRLCSTLLHSEGEAWARDFFSRFLDRVEGAVGRTLGLDAQAANWMDVDGELVYLDVTTPLMRDERGREQLDVRLFYRSLPWALRGPVRLTMTRSILDKFYEPRGAVLDFLGNLHKERLTRLLPAFVEQANERLSPPLTEAETAAYYKSDARMWELLQRLRRADRRWHRTVRRRTYPFLLPRHVRR